ncbi:MAG: hypothetical protein K9W43_05215 [Candidatus Thorarchaeota archaeon]|nr:hypothetical protein [Candidatus Thorarchaeota archaeon]
MTLSEIWFLLRLDLTQHGRISPPGKRSKKKRNWGVVFSIVLFPSIAIVVSVISFLVLSLFDWATVSQFVVNGTDFFAMLLNVLLVFSFIGSIMFAATTVGNSGRMEYLLVMPLRTRTIFLAKSIVLVIWSSLFWFSISLPIIIMLAWYSPFVLAVISVPLYVIFLFSLNVFGVGVGGLVGLGISRLVAGRRLLREAGYFVLTSLAILFSAFYYYFIYFSSDDSHVFDQFIQLLASFGLSSSITPGYIQSRIIISLLTGQSVAMTEILLGGLFLLGACLVLYIDAIVSEKAHYEGWLNVFTRRSSSRKITIKHTSWDPQPFRFIHLSQTISVSFWYNITSIRREGRVLAQYLLNPLRFTIFFLFPIFTLSEEIGPLSYLGLMLVVIQFATSYGIAFAGYETVYEGSNLMNLQLAAANMEEYVRGKVYSALPFILGVSIITSVFVIILAPMYAIYVPLLIIATAFTTLASGAYAAKQAATGGDFKAQRMILRQRGAAVRPPMKGWSAIKTQLVPLIFGFGGMIVLLGVGVFISPLLAYFVLAGYAFLCYRIEHSYSYSAGVALATIDAEKYL